MAPPPAGNSPHGAERRSALLEAAAELLEREGPRAVSHRAVAAEAKLPLAATTYYFDSREQLLREALERVASGEAQRLGALVAQLADDAGAARAAALGAPALIAELPGAMPKFECYVEACRRPDLQAACAGWIDAFRQLATRFLAGAGAPNPERAGRVLCAAIDGLMLQAMARTGHPPSEAELRGDLERLLDGLLSSGETAAR